jgi:hypothetical protein
MATRALTPAERNGMARTRIMDIQSIVSSFENSGGVQAAAAKAGASPEDTSAVTQAALEHADAGGGLVGIVDAVAQRAGVDPAIVNQILPHIMPLLQSHLAGLEGGQGGQLGGLMGMVGGLFGQKT